MGSNSSKCNETAVLSVKNEVDGCNKNNPDPRSPTPEIVRTPLQDKTGAKHNITKNVDLRKTFESTKGDEKLIHNNPILSAVIKNHLQSYDPRSPTQDFDRTPIVIASTIDELTNDKLTLRLQNDNCGSPLLTADGNCDSCAVADELTPDLIVPKNLCAGFYDMTLNDTIKESEEPLGSSTASNEAIEEIILKGSPENKLTQLLETNFDYVGGDQDKFEDSQEYVHSTDDSGKPVEVKPHAPILKILNEDPRSPSIGIERTPIVISKSNVDNSDDNVEEMSDDSLIKVLQNTNAELRQTVTNDNVEEILIYEDVSANINETPKKSKSASSSGSRTPLSCMKNKGDGNHTRSKSANTIFDPKTQKVQSKNPNRQSHIPRLKSLSKQSKILPASSSVSLRNISKASIIGGDCENTPPHSHRDIWDKDNSIVL